ncbi:MFS general substrate transporter [Hanseniaspora valbyensis NRRL Y-1626]|uniref:MFS general substrate transporter n=1 Tax=Hanseniaspora valbyensis NRRL Y-1626 TaxID=766949 RepID=A0A1B7TCK8_9ASCO|nr:MFS general substrate transporter [Hanseniaspora valbyensis NRRL Y-1626]
MTIPFSKRHIKGPAWARDIPRGFKELTTNWLKYGSKEYTGFKTSGNKYENEDEFLELEGYKNSPNYIKTEDDIDDKSENLPIFTKAEKRKIIFDMFSASACLLGDGYVNNSTGVISSGLKAVYGPQYSNSKAISNISAVVFAGEVFSIMLFGYFCDIIGRRTATLIGNVIMCLFSILLAGAWTSGTHSKPTATKYYLDESTGKKYPLASNSLWSYICFLRFMVGVGIGSEYPAGSSWSSDISKKLNVKDRNMWFTMFTNTSIDVGFVISSFVTWVLTLICGNNNMDTVWRVTVGIGAIIPFCFFISRFRMKESEYFERNRLQTKKIPYLLVYKFYWFRILCFGLVWVFYDFVLYGMSSISSLILDIVLGDTSDLKTVWGWNVLFNVFYLPGAFLGCVASKYFGPRWVGSTVWIQGIFGFVMAAKLDILEKNIAGFTVFYGIFITLGEFSLGNNLGILCANGFATPVKGSCYLWCAAMGKAAAFGSNYLFPKLIANGGIKAPFYYAGAMGLTAAALLIILCPPMDQVTQQLEDKRFMEYLEKQGYICKSIVNYKVEVLEEESEVEEVNKNSLKIEANSAN